MHILHCDETNLESRKDEFFVYGGIVFSSDSAIALHDAVEKLRSEFHVPADFMLKFNPGPAHLDHVSFGQLKQRVIEAAITSGCSLFATIISHNIAQSPDVARRNAINQLSYNFNAHLQSCNDYGFVFIDRFTDTQIDSHLRDKFSVGVTGLPYSPTFRLQRILGFHYAAIGQSNFGSVIDIVLGTLRFAVNAFSRQEQGKMERSRQFLVMLGPLFQKTSFSRPTGPWVTEISLDFTPKTIRSDRFRAQYQALRNYFAENGLVAAQDIK